MNSKMKQYNLIKQQCMFINKRAWQLTGGWKQGIVGVDDVETANTEIFWEKFLKISSWNVKVQNTQR